MVWFRIVLCGVSITSPFLHGFGVKSISSASRPYQNFMRQWRIAVLEQYGKLIPALTGRVLLVKPMQSRYKSQSYQPLVSYLQSRSGICSRLRRKLPCLNQANVHHACLLPKNAEKVTILSCCRAVLTTQTSCGMP